MDVPSQNLHYYNQNLHYYDQNYAPPSEEIYI